MEEAVAHWNKVGIPTMTLSTPRQITRFFGRLDLLPPVWCLALRGAPAPAASPQRSPSGGYGG
jgi:hypothetical protein